MIRREITPVAQLGSRAPEAGRIRMGVKSGKAMKSITEFRFTSYDQTVIEQLAQLYGGTAKPWHEPRANPPHQFEVLSTSSTIRVLLVPDGLSTHYEAWSAGGCQRRCDGVECESPQRSGDDYELVSQPCLCRAQGVRLCEPHTRLNVVLPEVAFIGVWRLETKGWNAAEELPGMFDLIAACAAKGVMVDAELSIRQQERMTPTGKKKFIVPHLSVKSSVLQLAEGGGALSIGPSNPPAPTFTLGELNAASEIAEAEIVDDDLLDIEAKLRADAVNFGFDGDNYIAAVKAQCEGDRARMRLCIDKVRVGTIEPMAFSQGRIQWKKATP